jgi:hypothetical protein
VGRAVTPAWRWRVEGDLLSTSRHTELANHAWSVADLLLAEQDIGQAVAELEPLHADLHLVYGPDHDDTHEIEHILARLRSSAAR